MPMASAWHVLRCLAQCRGLEGSFLLFGFATICSPVNPFFFMLTAMPVFSPIPIDALGPIFRGGGQSGLTFQSIL